MFSDEGHDGAHRRPWLEHPLDSDVAQARQIHIRNDASHHHQHVVEALLLKQLHDPGTHVVVGTRQDRQPDHAGVLLERGLDDLLAQLGPLGRRLERAGDLMEFDRKELGLGVVNPRTERVEPVEEIRQNIARALERYPQDQLFINPDCGFATFSNRPVNSDEIALNKVRAMREAVEPFR